MNKLIVILIMSLVPSCSMLDKVIDYGSDANDELVNASEKGLCRVPSIGAIGRKYNSTDKFKAWLEYCSKNDAEFPEIFKNILKNFPES